MTETNPFDHMRDVFAPKGTAQVTNLTSNLGDSFFGSELVLSAVNHAEKRIIDIANFPSVTEALSPLEIFAIHFLMRASDQDDYAPNNSSASTSNATSEI